MRFLTYPCFRLAVAAFVFCGLCPPARAYSVLTHEAIVDSLWDSAIKPLLLRRFPDSTPDQLIAAHGYAYGGCIIQDIGYYPFGNHLFSDLVHYVRSADFVEVLISDAQTLNEYAFALGAVAHYGADNSGHPIATNRAVPMLYPKLRRRFGDTVTYYDNPAAHIKTEFGFDVLQVARGDYAPQSYHDFIGFQVSKDLLDRAFQDTYGLPIKDIFASIDLTLGTYRFSVGRLIPEMTKAAWSLKKKEIVRKNPGITRRRFLYNLSRSSYRKDWGATYEKPGFFARLLAFFFRLIPKVGPFEALGFKTPTAQTELMFQQSFDDTIDHDRQYYAAVTAGKLTLPDTDLDTGRLTHQGEYTLTDETYSKLLEKLAETHFGHVSPELKANILSFYGSSGPTEAKAAAALSALRTSN